MEGSEEMEETEESEGLEGGLEGAEGSEGLEERLGSQEERPGCWVALAEGRLEY